MSPYNFAEANPIPELASVINNTLSLRKDIFTGKCI